MLNKPLPVGNVINFSDCSSNSYYYDAVRWASSSGVGIVLGKGDGTYNPEGSISEQDMMVFLYRLACYCEYSENTTAAQNSYINILKNSSLKYRDNFLDYAKAAVGWGYNKGFINDVNIIPTNNCLRGNTALYLHNFYKIFQKNMDYQ